jgi:LysM repeat protein
MERRTSASARIFAALALVGAVLVLVAIVAANLGGDSSSDHRRSAQTTKHEKHEAQKPPPAAYVVQSGDTLTSIAHETGVPVAEIIALNPEVDPQILIAGETLKLR